MAYNAITDVNITLQVSGITSQGFGTPLFIADIDISTDPDPIGAGVRIKAYNSLTEVATDFQTTDAAYLAAQQFLANTPSVSTIKIGYRNIQSGNVETPAEAIQAIRDQDDDWYFLTAQTHVTADVMAYAVATEALTRQYFTSSQDQTTLTTYVEGTSNDALAELKEGNYERSKGFFHHQADTTWPECKYVGYNAPFLAGQVIWTNLRVTGLPASQDPSTSRPLTSAQKAFLEARSASYTERLGSNTVIIRGGTAASGTSLDFIRGRDNLEADINTALQSLLTRQQGTKIPYTNAGITQIYDSVDTVLNRYSIAPRSFINNNYVLSFPMAGDVPLADKEARVYQSGTFTAELQGAIERVVINGSLTLRL